MEDDLAAAGAAYREIPAQAAGRDEAQARMHQRREEVVAHLERKPATLTKEEADELRDYQAILKDGR